MMLANIICHVYATINVYLDESLSCFYKTLEINIQYLDPGLLNQRIIYYCKRDHKKETLTVTSPEKTLTKFPTNKAVPSLFKTPSFRCSCLSPDILDLRTPGDSLLSACLHMNAILEFGVPSVFMVEGRLCSP